jgi:hypothetical protein
MSHLPDEAHSASSPSASGGIGQQLLLLIEACLERRRSESDVLADSWTLGLAYGREMVATGCSVRQAVESFTLGRRRIEELARHRCAGRCTPSHAWDDRDALTPIFDQFLLGLADAYDATPGAHSAPTGGR